MRAYLDFSDDAHAVSDMAYVCEEFNGVETSNSASIPMKAKSYYIEDDVTENTQSPRKVRIDVTGLSNAALIELLSALNAAGFEAEITTGPFLDAGKWYPQAPTQPNSPFTPGLPYKIGDTGYPYTINVTGGKTTNTTQPTIFDYDE